MLWGVEPRQPGTLSQHLASPSLGLWEETQWERNLLFMGEAARIPPQHVAPSFPGWEAGSSRGVEQGSTPRAPPGLWAPHGAAPPVARLRPPIGHAGQAACSRGSPHWPP